MSILIKNGRVVTASEDSIADIFIEGEKISAIGKNLSIKGEYIEGKDAAIKKAGYYAQSSYFIFPKKFQMLVKYDSFDPDKTKTKIFLITTSEV